MAFLNETYDVNDLPQGDNFEPLPAGWYDVTITGAELKTTKARNGQYISVRYDVTGPTHQGRVVFGSLNIKNPSQKAEEIGRQHLGDLMRAIGLSRITDTDQLIGGTLQIKLSVRDQDGFDPTNEVKGYKSISGSVPTFSAPASSPTPTSTKSAPPWARK